MLHGRRPGISLKLSATLSLMIVGEMVLLAALLGREPQSPTAVVFMFVLGALAAGLVLAAALDWLVTRPLLHLLQQVRDLPARGYATPVRARGIDEPRELGEALEAMRQVVVSREEELRRLNQELEARVEARTAELRRAQQQLVQAEKLASVGELAGGVAHEINNPTGVILARASYLVSVADEEGFDPDVIEDLEVVVHQATRIRTITGDLLSFGRRAGGTVEAVELREVATLAVNLLRHAATRASVEVTVAPGDAGAVRGRREGLEQAIFNLLKNAIEATPPGGRVEVGIREEEAQVALTVDDTGPGVPPDLRGRIFDPFFTTKPVGKGTGLGLSVTYGIVSDHEGRIEVEEAPTGGARFQVVLPAAEPAVPVVPPPLATPAEG